MTPDTKTTPQAAAEFRATASLAAEKGVVFKQSVSPQFAALVTGIPADILKKIGVAILPVESGANIEFIFSRKIFPIIQRSVTVSLEDEYEGEDQLRLKAELYRAIYTIVQQQVNSPTGYDRAKKSRHGKLIAAAAETIRDLEGIIDTSTNISKTKVLTNIELTRLQEVATGLYDEVIAGNPALIQDFTNQGWTPRNMFVTSD